MPPWLCSKANIYPGFTRFRGILSLIQVYILKSMENFAFLRKIFLDPSYVPKRFFMAARGRAHAI
jgi:hypothetical protein